MTLNHKPSSAVRPTSLDANPNSGRNGTNVTIGTVSPVEPSRGVPSSSLKLRNVPVIRSPRTSPFVSPASTPGTPPLLHRKVSTSLQGDSSKKSSNKVLVNIKNPAENFSMSTNKLSFVASVDTRSDETKNLNAAKNETQSHKSKINQQKTKMIPKRKKSNGYQQEINKFKKTNSDSSLKPNRRIEENFVCNEKTLKSKNEHNAKAITKKEVNKSNKKRSRGASRIEEKLVISDDDNSATNNNKISKTEDVNSKVKSIVTPATLVNNDVTPNVVGNFNLEMNNFQKFTNSSSDSTNFETETSKEFCSDTCLKLTDGNFSVRQILNESVYDMNEQNSESDEKIFNGCVDDYESISSKDHNKSIDLNQISNEDFELAWDFDRSQFQIQTSDGNQNLVAFGTQLEINDLDILSTCSNPSDSYNQCVAIDAESVAVSNKEMLLDLPCEPQCEIIAESNLTIPVVACEYVTPNCSNLLDKEVVENEKKLNETCVFDSQFITEYHHQTLDMAEQAEKTDIDCKISETPRTSLFNVADSVPCSVSPDCPEEFIQCVFQMSLVEVTGSTAAAEPIGRPLERDCANSLQHLDSQLETGLINSGELENCNETFDKNGIKHENMFSENAAKSAFVYERRQTNERNLPYTELNGSLCIGYDGPNVNVGLLTNNIYANVSHEPTLITVDQANEDFELAPDSVCLEAANEPPEMKQTIVSTTVEADPAKSDFELTVSLTEIDSRVELSKKNNNNDQIGDNHDNPSCVSITEVKNTMQMNDSSMCILSKIGNEMTKVDNSPLISEKSLKDSPVDNSCAYSLDVANDFSDGKEQNTSELQTSECTSNEPEDNGFPFALLLNEYSKETQNLASNEICDFNDVAMTDVSVLSSPLPPIADQTCSNMANIMAEPMSLFSGNGIENVRHLSITFPVEKHLLEVDCLPSKLKTANGVVGLISSVATANQSSDFTIKTIRSQLRLPLKNTANSLAQRNSVPSSGKSPASGVTSVRRTSTNSNPDCAQAGNKKSTISKLTIDSSKSMPASVPADGNFNRSAPNQIKRKLTPTESGDKKRSAGFTRSIGESIHILNDDFVIIIRKS